MLPRAKIRSLWRICTVYTMHHTQYKVIYKWVQQHSFKCTGYNRVNTPTCLCESIMGLWRTGTSFSLWMNYVVQWIDNLQARYGDDWPHQNRARALHATCIALYVRVFPLRSRMARAMLVYTRVQSAGGQFLPCHRSVCKRHLQQPRARIKFGSVAASASHHHVSVISDVKGLV